MTLEDLFVDTSPKPVVEKPPPRPRGDITTTVPAGFTIEYKDSNHRYKLDGEYVSSVSSITGALDKPQLKWWAQGVAVNGVLELVRRDVVAAELLASSNQESLVALLTEQKLTVNHIRKEAADRGSRVHDAMEDWARSGVLPDPEIAEEGEQGYIVGLRAFIVESNLEPDGIETIIGSREHRFAGRCDLLRARIPQPFIGCIRIDRKTGEETRTIIPAGLYVADLKTTSGVFKEAHFQVAGYEGGGVESGYDPSDHQAILRVTVDGRYEFVESVATYADFLAVKQAYDAGKRIDKVAA